MSISMAEIDTPLEGMSRPLFKLVLRLQLRMEESTFFFNSVLLKKLIQFFSKAVVPHSRSDM